MNKKTEKEIDQLCIEQRDLQIRMLDRWKFAKIDALLMPAFASCAFKAKNAGDLGAMVDYVALWSVLHYPQGVLPITKVTEEETKVYNDGHNDLWTK